MKTREIKQRDLVAITESLANSKSAMVVSFTKLSVQKDQEFRNSLREAGAQYQVVKNTLARIAVKGTQFEQATEAFKGVTAIAWTDNDPVVLSKAITKFMKDNGDTYTFKSGVVDGRLVDITQLNTIASLPSKEELISKLLFVLNAQAQRIVTVINAVPRDLAVVIKQIGDQPDRAAGAPKAEAAPAENEGADDAAAAEVVADVPSTEGVDDAAAAEVAAPDTSTEAGSESAANAPDDAAQAETEAPAAE
jgi:large subunit ribosomal protein L10